MREGAIERHTAELAAAREEISGLDHERRGLLLNDGSDERIREIEHAKRAADLRIERLDALRGALAAKLADARDAVREARFLELKAAYWPAAERWLEHARGAIGAIDEMNQIRAEALSANLRAEAASFFHPAARQLSDEAIREFDRAITRAREVADGKPGGAEDYPGRGRNRSLAARSRPGLARSSSGLDRLAVPHSGRQGRAIDSRWRC
jgi:hypothetical protein